MTERDNELSSSHTRALSQTLTCFAKLALGEETGRWAIPLAASLGKTQAAISFIIAASKLIAEKKLPDTFALTVAATKVEDLCEMLRACREAGVPESDLGLTYSRTRFTYDPDIAKEYLAAPPESGVTMPPGYVSERATPDLSTRRFAFVTHARAEIPEEQKPGR